MKILFSAFVVDPDSGSEPQMAWQWIYGAAINNHEVHVMTVQNSAEKISIKSQELGLLNIHVYPLPAPQYPNFLNREIAMYLGYLRWQSRLAKYVQRHALENCDIAHHTSWGNIGLGTGLSRMKIPYVFGPAGGGTIANPKLRYFFDEDWKKERIRTYLRYSYRFLSFPRRSARKASIILATNQASYSLASTLGSKCIRLFLAESIPSTEIQVAVQKPNSPTAIFVARFMHRKGANLALLAFSQSLSKFPHARLIMVGDGPTLSRSKELAAELGIWEKVEFTGRVPWLEVQEIYKQATVFIFPSLRDSSGAQVLEAAAKGIPIIALEGSGVSEWLPNAGLITAPIGNMEATIQNLSNGINVIFGYTSEEWINASRSLTVFATENSRERKVEMMNRIYMEIYTKSKMLN
jgi:glycosyltransferase involved in cell wall biosynthesis